MPTGFGPSFSSEINANPVVIAPTSANVLKNVTGAVHFTASGGRSPYTYSFDTNGSGASIGSSSGILNSGATGAGALDVVRVTDSEGNFALAAVQVYDPIVIAGGSAKVAPNTAALLPYTASGGSGFGYNWAVSVNNSGNGSIDAATAIYTGGDQTTGVHDTIMVTDSLGFTQTTTGPLITNPSTILGSTLKLWLIVNTTNVTSPAHSPIQDGDLVNGWHDVSGIGDANRNFTQPTAANQPTYVASDPDLNGHASIHFDKTSVDKWLASAIWSTTYVQPWTIFVVLRKKGSLSSNQYIWSSETSGVNREDLFLNTIAPAGRLSVVGQINILSSAVIPAFPPAYATSALFNGIGSKIWANSKTALVTGQANAGSVGSFPVSIGANIPSHPLVLGLTNTNIPEIIMTNQALSSGMISDLFDYFGGMYGITITP